MGTVARSCLVIIGISFRLSIVVAESGTFFTSCEDREALATVKNMEIEGCSSDPCELQAGSSPTFNIGFVPSVDVSGLKAVASGIVNGIPLEYHISKVKTCIFNVNGVFSKVFLFSNVYFCWIAARWM